LRLSGIGGEVKIADIHFASTKLAQRTQVSCSLHPNGRLTATLAYKRFENTVATLAEDPAKRVEVKIEARYNAGNVSNRPDEFVASYRVDGGRWREQSFINK